MSRCGPFMAGLQPLPRTHSSIGDTPHASPQQPPSPGEGPVGGFLPSAVTGDVFVNCVHASSTCMHADVSWEEIPKGVLMGRRVAAYVTTPAVAQFSAAGMGPFCVAARTE